MNRIGLHVRFQSSWKELAEHALQLNVPHFQCFLPVLDNHRMLGDDLRNYLNKFDKLYAHGSYRINYASRNHVHYMLKAELDQLTRLGFTHYVIHPGAYEQGSTLDEGIDHVARVVNSIIKKYPHISVLIENTAYDGRTIGFELSHLGRIYQKIDNSDRVGICIDSAHAYVAGYDIVQNLNGFYDELAGLLPRNSIKLLHVSDTPHACGSFCDLHCMIGAGRLGEQILKEFVKHPFVSDAAIIIELPHATQDEELQALTIVRSWF